MNDQSFNGPGAACQGFIAYVNTPGNILPDYVASLVGIDLSIAEGSIAYQMGWRGDCIWLTTGPDTNNRVQRIGLYVMGGCASGYTMQSDGTCAVSRPPAQVCTVGNPVIPGAGTTAYLEPSDGGSTDVPITLAYRSYSVYGLGAGAGQWTSNWQRSLDTSVASYSSTQQVMAQRDDGSVSTYTKSGTTWTAPDTQDTVQSVTDASNKIIGWQYTVANTGSVETYDANGQLQSVRDRHGRTTTLTYNATNQLATVTGPSGRSQIFAAGASGRISSITAPDGAVTKYGYNTAGMLSSITRPDGAVRQYVYENTRFPTALTGVVDENGNRFATYAYDDQARAISNVHAGGADAYRFQYGDNNQTTVTDPTGKTSVYSFLKQNGVLLPTSISAPCGLCGSTRQSSSYDAINNLIQETDYLGNDSQKREIQRVEGSGTSSARTTSTQWHPQFWNLRTQVAMPTKLESYSYDGNGNLTSYSETPTADRNGSQGFSASAMGSTRTMTWTYTADGRVATSNGPRTDVNDGATYVYRTTDDADTPPQYRKGDLYQTVDPLGRTSTINQYDPNGRPLQMVDANGTVTTFAYSNRGWLTSQTVTLSSGAGQTTSYSYDAVGQLTKVTLPDGGAVNFSYDAAHRMTGAADSLGNSISYTLDAMGNRTQEQVKDPSGHLARQITRVFDSMNRPLKVTVGAMQ
ncbi:RHS repeat protein [Ralstonia solanacearum]|uniref:RHS repeat protein n=1 Tax=Ralstonia solanacearum TaxID=305 RepID=UPI00399D6CAF